GRGARRGGARSRGDARRPWRRPPVPGRRRAEREQGRSEALQGDDRLDERRVLPHAARADRRRERAAAGSELGARDRGERPGPRSDRGRDARRHSRRLPAGRGRDLRGQLRRAAGQAPLPPPRDPGRMSVVVLEPRAEPAVPLEAPGIRPDAFAALDEAEIARLPVWHGNETAQVGDFFRVSGGRSADVRIAGDAGRVKHLGNAMAGGRLVIEGNAGTHVGAEMTGGRIIVEGDAGPWAGAEMRGGVLEIRGNAASHLAAAYAGSRRGTNGGLVLVHGSAGDLVAERMRRGIVAVAGDVGDYAGAAMLAGTLLVFGRLGRRPG